MKVVRSVNCAVKGVKVKWEGVHKCQLPVVFRNLYMNESQIGAETPELQSLIDKLCDFKYLHSQCTKMGDDVPIVQLELGGHYMKSTHSIVHVSITDVLEKFMHEEIDSDNLFEWYLAQAEVKDMFPFLYENYKEGANDPKLLPQAVRTTGKGTLYRNNLWLSGEYPNSSSPMHHDPFQNLLIQCYKEKHVLLFHPDAAEGLYPALGTVQKNTSTIDFDALNLDLMKEENYADTNEYANLVKEHPEFAKHALQYMRVPITLQPGDALFIPFKWWHYMRADRASLSTNYWWL